MEKMNAKFVVILEQLELPLVDFVGVNFGDKLSQKVDVNFPSRE